MAFATAILFEDYLPGPVHEFAAITVEEKDIIDFGRQFDPQALHTNCESINRDVTSCLPNGSA